MHNLSGFLLAGALALGATDATAAVVRDGYSWHTRYNEPYHPVLRIRLRPDNTKFSKERPLQVAGGVCRRDAGRPQAARLSAS